MRLYKFDYYPNITIWRRGPKHMNFGRKHVQTMVWYLSQLCDEAPRRKLVFPQMRLRV